ncbi:MAG: ribonuclease R [Clostridia bacterium]
MNQIITDIIHACSTPKKREELYPILPQYSKKKIKDAFELAIKRKLILPYKAKTYASRDFFNVIEATFLSTKTGFAFAEPIVALKSGRDVFIPEGKRKNAWHGDTVLIKLLPTRRKKDKKGVRQEGEVLKILKRDDSPIVGVLSSNDNGEFFVNPARTTIPPIKILEKNLNSAKISDKVAVKIRFEKVYKDSPEGIITEVFGSSDTLQASESAILHLHGINKNFPPLVDVQTKGVSVDITEEMFGKRLNLCDKMIFTIDGDLSKDFDDAVSLEELGDGTFLLGVHIADVSHYVTEGSPLDLEAFDRGTSVYFANQVVPMLPFELSNGICSLNPLEKRFTMSAFITLDKNFDVLSTSFHKSVIISKHRLTYNKVNALLDGDADLCEQYADIIDILVKMNKIAKKLEQKRFTRGALDLNLPESYIITDENNQPIDIKLRTRGDSEKLIEQFMVLANECVAEYMFKSEIPAVYRVHDTPNIEKLEFFAETARSFGYKILDDELTNPVALQSVLNKSTNTPHHKVLSTMLLRSLARARYDENCTGHNGLSSEFYLHFTSPIRRYPDLVVHRMLAKKIENETITAEDKNFVELSSIQSTDREKHADDASRDIEKLYLAKYMSQFIGSDFEAVVSGVQHYGIFVELENGVEGLIRIEDFPKDDYFFDEKNVNLVGKNSKIVYNIGMNVSVTLVNSSFVNGRIDFTFKKTSE